MEMQELIERIEQGQKARWIRKQLGWSQIEMTDYLKKIGKTNQSNYCHMEKGRIPLGWRYEAILALFRKERPTLIAKIEQEILDKQELIDEMKKV